MVKSCKSKTFYSADKAAVEARCVSWGGKTTAQELRKESPLHFSSRRLKSYDVTANLAFIDHQSAILCVDTSLLGAFQHQMMSVFQFIGELEAVEVIRISFAKRCLFELICWRL
jgi:hypothetical protein